MFQTRQDPESFVSVVLRALGARKILKLCWEADVGKIWTSWPASEVFLKEMISGVMKMMNVASPLALVLPKLEPPKIVPGSKALPKNGLIPRNLVLLQVREVTRGTLSSWRKTS